MRSRGRRETAERGRRTRAQEDKKSFLFHLHTRRHTHTNRQREEGKCRWQTNIREGEKKKIFAGGGNNARGATINRREIPRKPAKERDKRAFMPPLRGCVLVHLIAELCIWTAAQTPSTMACFFCTFVVVSSFLFPHPHVQEGKTEHNRRNEEVRKKEGTTKNRRAERERREKGINSSKCAYIAKGGKRG